MDKDLLIGIDVGTTGTKAIAADAHGTVLAEAGQEYATAFPHANWAEQNPDDWWDATCAVLQRLFADHAVDAQRVAAVAVSCQAPSLVAVDRDGRPLLPALIWMDRRTEAECDWLRAHVDEAAITRVNGGRVDPYYLAPKLLWLQRQRPDLYAATHTVLQANGYVVHKLCGAFSMDVSHGPLTLFFDSAAQTWSDELLQAMALDRAKLPPLVGCMDIVGHVTAAAAQATGLAPGTPILGGMTDGTAASVEAGLVEPGDAAEMTGQSTVLLICSDQPYLGRDLIPLGHPQPGRFLVVGALVASGGALRWFRDQLGEPERQAAARTGVDAYELLSRSAATSPPGAHRLIFLPYMFGERSPIWDSDARGVFFGLSLATQKADLVRAVMEGAAYGLRHNVDAAAAGGFAITEMACVGGGARSAVWNQIKADVLQLPVTLPRAATGAPMGDAIIAAVAAGLHPTLGDAVAAMVAPGPIYTPRPEYAARYDALYDVYVGLYPQLRASFKQLADVPDDD
ncbi:MAG: FGGY-family carbohydrate kinase [Caldilineaceae bacterium]|nr:FGGY-family carbohydrate kinase [Caldilineaceae bacterium]